MTKFNRLIKRSMSHRKASGGKIATQKPVLSHFSASKVIALIGVWGLVGVIAIISDFNGLFQTSISASTPAVEAKFEMVIKGGKE